MIPEYKLYHGAVLAELVDCLDQSVSINELVENGRLTSYVLDDKVGLQIKHAMQRISPWQFTFTAANVRELGFLQMTHAKSFVVLVCHCEGMVCLRVEEVVSLLSFVKGDQASIRVSKHRNHFYSITSGATELPTKKPDGLGPLLEALKN
jgi:hypothetical protein